MSQYNVFLSHNSADKTAVEYLARRLTNEAKLTPFLDKWHLIPGEPWQEALETALDDSQTCAVFLGRSGLGAWENEEMRAALERRVKNPGFRVIPVLLPGSKMPERGQLPRFLSRLTWVDFREGLDEPEAFRLFVAGIHGVAPGPSSESLIFLNQEPPYRGLEKFRPEDAKWFFGRESEVQQLIEKLKTQRFIAILGASGSGKSSVVLGGLVPALKEGALVGSQEWSLITLTPTDQPLQELAIQLSGLTPIESTSGLLRDLESDERTLHMVVRRALKGAPDTCRVVMIVDQFEEIFTLCKNENSRKQFLNNLLYASGIESGRTLLLLTMRADFLSKCAPYDELADRLAAFQFFITPMVNDQMRQAIEAPATQAGLELEPGLADLILDDIADEPGALPLLEHALLELWKRRDGRTLTFKAYKEIGGATGALTRSADTLYTSLNESQKKVLQRILLLMVNPGEGTEDTARRAKQSELVTQSGDQEGVEFVLRRLADQRLVTTGQERDTEQVVVSLAHEALIRNWSLMQQWINDNRESLLIHRRLAEAADEWVGLERDDGLLYRGARLVQTQEWMEKHAIEMTPRQNEFLQASSIARKAEEQAHEENFRRQEQLVAERHTGKRLRRLAVGLAIVVLFALMASLIAIQQSAVANQARDELANEVNVRSTAQAEAQNKEAEVRELNRVIQANELAAQAQAQVRAYPQRSILLSIEAIRMETQGGEEFPAAAGTLREVLTQVGGIGSSGPEVGSTNLSFSRNNRWLAIAGADGVVRLLEMNHPEAEPILFSGHEYPITSLAFSVDNHWLLTQDTKVVRLWDLTLQDPTTEPTYTVPAEMYDSAALSPDSRWLVTGYSGDEVFEFSHQLWRLNADGTMKPPVNLPRDRNPGPLAAFSPDSRWLVTTDENNALLWNLSAENPAEDMTILAGYDVGLIHNNVEAVTFSQDSRLLATVDEHGIAALWDLSMEDVAAHPRYLRTGGEKSISFDRAYADAAISADKRWLVTASADTPARLWDLAAEDPAHGGIVLPSGEASVSDVAISLDSRWLITANEWPDNSIRFWDLTAADPTANVVVRYGHEERISAMQISSDSRWLATASLDWLTLKGSVRLWNLRNQVFAAQPILFFHSEAPISGINISADNRWLFVGNSVDFNLWDTGIDYEDQFQYARLWHLEGGGLLGDAIVLQQIEGAVSTTAFSPDGRWFAAGEEQKYRNEHSDKDAWLWDLSAKDPAASAIELPGHQSSVVRIMFSPNSERIATLDEVGTLRLWDVRAENPGIGPVLLNTGGARAIVFSPNSRSLFALSEYGSLEQWDLNPSLPVLLDSSDEIDDWISAYAISSDGHWLLAGTQNKKRVYLWNLEEKSVDPYMSFEVQSEDVVDIRSMALSPDNRWLVTGSEWPTAGLWDLQAKQPEEKPILLEGHRDSVWWVDITDQWMVTSSQDGIAQLWTLPVEGVIAQPAKLEDVGGPLAISSDNRWLATSNRDSNSVYLWNLRLEDIIQIACQTAGRNLTVEEWDHYLSPSPYRKTCDQWPADAAIFANDLEEIRTTLNNSDLTESVKLYDTLLKLNQVNNWALEKTLSRQYGQLLLSYAWNQVTLGNTDEAMAAFEFAIKYGTSLNVDPYLEAGQGNIDEAIAVSELAIKYEPSLKLDPDREAGQTLVETGRSLAKQGKIDGAIAVFEIAKKYDASLKIDPHVEAGRVYAQVLVEKGSSLAEQGKIDEAVVAFEQAKKYDASLKIDPHVEAGRVYAQVLVEKGSSLAEQGKIDEAVVAFELAMKYDSEGIPARNWNTLCWFGALWQQAEKVLDACDKAVALSVGKVNADYRDSRGVARAMTGDIEGAIDDFEVLVEAYQGELEAHQRQEWINMLKAGQNPFENEELLEELRQ